MGFAKNQMMECEERGFGSIDEIVCEHCVGDYALKNFIVDNGENGICDYCGESSVCIDVESLVGQIVDGIRCEYEEAIECMGIDEGEYVGANTWDTYELVHYELGADLGLHDKLLDDVARTINNVTWCEIDPYSLRISKERVSAWNAFSQMVKNSTRYVFFRMPKCDEFNEESPFIILDHIGEEVKKLELVRTLPVGVEFYRGRMHDSATAIKCECELSSPPHERAKSNRMSAEGISVFYGADCALTAISEIYDSKYKRATVAVFRNLKAVQILDLTKIGKLPFPSLFDEKRREHREPLKFLRELVKNLTQPIETMESIEYIPAQIVAEYFRFIFSHNDKPIDGIAYNSSKTNNGICYALFFDQSQCLECDEAITHQMLKMDNSTLETYNVTAEIRITPI